MAGKNPMIDDLQQIQKEFQKLPYEAAEEVMNFTSENFRKEEFQDKPSSKWKARKKDPEKGKKRKERRALLVQSGEMKNSIDTEVRGMDIAIGIDDPDIAVYAKVHNEGQKAGRGKGFIMPKRQFMGPSEVLDERIEKLVDKKIAKILK